MANINRFVKKKKNVLPKLRPALCLTLSLAVGHRRCIFQSELSSRIVNLRQLQIFSMPNISRVSATHRRWPQIASLIIHTVSTDLPLISAICLGFIKTCRRVKNRAKMSEYLCSRHSLQALRESLRAWAQTGLRKQSRRAGLYTWNWTESAHEYSLLLSTGESLDYSLSGYRLGFREQHTHTET